MSTGRVGDTDKSATPDAYAQMMNPKFLKSYKDLTMPIDVKGDLTGLTLQMVDQPAGASAKPPTP